MDSRQGHHTFKTRFRTTLLSAALSGLGMLLMTPAVEAAVLQSKTYSYDAQGRVLTETDAYGNSVTYTYDGNGNRKTSTDALGRVTTNDYDPLDRLKKVTVSANNAVQSVTEYGYDGRDNLTTVTDPRGLVTSYTYNGLDQLTAQASPDTGTTSYVPNPAGQVTTRTNAASQATQYQYDALGRVSQASYADGRVVTYTYDQGSYGQGRLTGLADSESSLAWTYDADGHVLTRTQTLGAQSSTLTYGYNASGQLTSLTLPSGAVVGYSYDDQGRPAALTRDGVTVLSNLQYRPFGGITGWTWGNGQLHTRTYDQNGRLDLLSVGSTVHDLNYDIVSRIDDLADLADSSKNKDFSYDTLDRLIGYTGQNSTRAWSYDAVGNRTAQTIGSTNETYSYASTSNRLQSLTNSGNSAQNRTYQYTSTGHTSSDGVNTFTYDARERLVTATTPAAAASYTLNPLGQRIRKSVTQSGVTTTTTFLYDDAGHLVAESSSTGEGSEYVFLGDIPVAVNRTTLQNTQGTPIVVDPGASTYINSWSGGSASYITNVYGGNYWWKTANSNYAQEGVLVDDDNAYNTAPNSSTTSGPSTAGGWGSTTVTNTVGVKMRHRYRQPGVHLGTVVDNAAATFTGSWTNATCTIHCIGGGIKYTAPSTSATATATWTFTVATAGEYEIAASIPNGYTQVTNPTYTIQYGGSTVPASLSLTADMKTGGRWASLGTYQLPAGSLTVTLSNQASGGSQVYADAVSVGETSASITPSLNYYTWTANLPEAGTYKVYARTGSTSGGEYTVNHAQGSTTTTLSGVSGWLLLGTYDFNAGLNTVSVSDRGTETSMVIADTVVFAKPDAQVAYYDELKWVPTLPAAGTYDVQVRWPTVPEHIGTSSIAWFFVRHSQGITKVVKNLREETGQWVSLGQFNLDPATAKVSLSDYGTPGSRMYADAARFVPVSNSTSTALYYIHPDHLNTPRQLTTSDAQNTVVWRWESEPFGSTLADADPDQNGQSMAFNLRFPGQYFDAETQLHYNYFRDYNPGLGRYSQSDPLGLSGGLNTYAYVRGNPVSLVDSLGLAPGQVFPTRRAAAVDAMQYSIQMQGIGYPGPIYEVKGKCDNGYTYKWRGAGPRPPYLPWVYSPNNDASSAGEAGEESASSGQPSLAGGQASAGGPRPPWWAPPGWASPVATGLVVIGAAACSGVCLTGAVLFNSVIGIGDFLANPSPNAAAAIVLGGAAGRVVKGAYGPNAGEAAGAVVGLGLGEAVGD